MSCELDTVFVERLERRIMIKDAACLLFFSLSKILLAFLPEKNTSHFCELKFNTYSKIIHKKYKYKNKNLSTHVTLLLTAN